MIVSAPWPPWIVNRPSVSAAPLNTRLSFDCSEAAVTKNSAPAATLASFIVMV
jgi:hypothetical protein